MSICRYQQRQQVKGIDPTAACMRIISMMAKVICVMRTLFWCQSCKMFHISRTESGFFTDVKQRSFDDIKFDAYDPYRNLQKH